MKLEEQLVLSSGQFHSEWSQSCCSPVTHMHSLAPSPSCIYVGWGWDGRWRKALSHTLAILIPGLKVWGLRWRNEGRGSTLKQAYDCRHLVMSDVQ